MIATVISKPSVQTRNSFYLSNREPLLATPLVKLPLGAVRPRGWLRHQLELMRKGMTGQLIDLSEHLQPDNGWLGGNKPGWEEQPYWLRGFYDLAVLTGDARLLAKAQHWIEAVISSQDPDGYFGVKSDKCIAGKNRQKTCDLWPQMVMLDAVISHYEHTHDSRVIPWMTRFFHFCGDLSDELFLSHKGDPAFGAWHPAVQYDRAGDMVPHLHWLYNQIGEKGLLDVARRFFQGARPPVNEWLDTHNVHFAQRFSYPCLYYPQSHQRWHLEQSEYWYRQHLATWGQQPRGIFAADEQLQPGCVDPRYAFETCGMVEFNKSFYLMGRITGDPIYADRVEDITLNHFPVAQTSDLKSLHYLTASNQPQLDASNEHAYFNKGMIWYSPHTYRCCQHNVAMGWPWYVKNLWQATADNGLAAWLYAACDVNAMVGNGTMVQIHVETDYPFKSAVIIRVETQQKVSFPLYLRVPAWCSRFAVTVNGERVGVSAVPRSYVRLERTWSAGDRVEIDMPMEITLTQWPRNGSVTVDRGPLSYSLKIGERWQRHGGTEQWPEWEVFPATSWNYGLVIDTQNPRTSLRLKEKETVADQPWTVEAAPIEIVARMKRIPNWGLQETIQELSAPKLQSSGQHIPHFKLLKGTVQELQTGPIHSAEPEEEMTLIPMGCARLRMSCLPIVSDSPDAREWECRDITLKKTLERIDLNEIHAMTFPDPWHFKLDQHNCGEKEKWFDPELDESDWRPIRTDQGTGWEKQGFECPLPAWGWYRTKLTLTREQLNQKYFYLFFEAADEEALIYWNGKKVFEHSLQTTGLSASDIWQVAFSVSISKDRIHDGKNVLVVCVYNTAGMGGLYKPVHVFLSNQPLTEIERYAFFRHSNCSG